MNTKILHFKCLMLISLQILQMLKVTSIHWQKLCLFPQYIYCCNAPKSGQKNALLQKGEPNPVQCMANPKPEKWNFINKIKCLYSWKSLSPINHALVWFIMGTVGIKKFLILLHTFPMRKQRPWPAHGHPAWRGLFYDGGPSFLTPAPWAFSLICRMWTDPYYFSRSSLTWSCQIIKFWVIILFSELKATSYLEHHTSGSVDKVTEGWVLKGHQSQDRCLGKTVSTRVGKVKARKERRGHAELRGGLGTWEVALVRPLLMKQHRCLNWLL